MALTLEDLPFSLKANDIVKHVINIDSRFRLQSTNCDTNDFTFYYNLLTPIRNVLRIRVTSLELANNFYTFSAYRQNTTLILEVSGALTTITVPDGNYFVNDMINALDEQLSPFGIQVTFSAVSGHFTFYGTTPFILHTATPEGLSHTRTYDYGLGYNLGFSRGSYPSVSGNDASGNPLQVVVSNQTAYFAGDPYVFLKVNDYACVRQTLGDTDFTALAKMVVTQSKDYMSFDDYAGQHAKEVTFPNPVDLSRFKVQLVDMYGLPISMGSAQLSFSLEVLEVKNMTLYNTIRDAFAVEWIVKPGQTGWPLGAPGGRPGGGVSAGGFGFGGGGGDGFADRMGDPLNRR